MASLSVLHILRTIKERGTLSRTDLQQLTGLSWGTITNTTRELLDRNLIREEGTLQTKAGRKPMRLAINPVSHSLLGVDISPGLLRVIALNLAGEMLWQNEQAYQVSAEPSVVLDQLAGMILEGLGNPMVAARICLGVGVAAQGALDVRQGVMRFAPRMPGWTNVPIREHLQVKIPVPVLLEHDPNCLALAERWFGEASMADDVLCLNLSDGIGMGILLKGEIFRGAQQMAGEFGHITLDPEGPLCACGDRGCVEAYCSTPAIIEAVRQDPAGQSPQVAEALAKGTLTLDGIVAAAYANDETVRRALARMGRYLGVGIANIIDLFNPSVVVLCGPLTLAAEFFLPAATEQIAKHAWKHSSRQTIISSLGDRAVAIGACGMVLQSVFDQEPASNGQVRQLQGA